MLHRLGTVESTQLEASGKPIGDVVVADHQTAGRGRLDRKWDGSEGGGLYATFVLPVSPLVVFAVGVAAAEACGGEVRLKWPNDLVLEGLKLGGILAEVRGGRALVGLGVNLAWAPEGATRLHDDRDALLERLVPLVERWTSAPPEAVISRWRELSWTLGQEVRVEIGDRVVEGLASDVDVDGALLVNGERVVAGDVTRLRTA